ncbi:MAG: ammonium transporter [Oscillospiraceae bacterium]|nr:ammonium transporter [Oscillospiraceae bacterium]
MTQEIIEGVQEIVSGTTFSVWFLIGAALVFWMQAGFAMVESGFARAKNTGNILMKNLMDFCIGTVMFILIGFSLLLGEDMLGIIGKPGFDIFTDYANFDWSNFVFNLVFCATTATIVSGAMAERTKFSSYCIYSAVISAIIYPIEAHWVWGGGWLAQIGFHDFAGSVAIHMVGGVCALIGAAMVGPRIGKFVRDKDGKVTKVHAFPGHNIAIGALGVFILWLGWYGFNGAAATSVEQLGSIFLTTTVAPAVATVVCMLFTWFKYGKPDVSMCLNAALAGLVGITAGCDVMDCFGAIMVGIVSGLLVVFGVWLLDYKLHVDDPVGAVAVHCFNGIWGGLAVGLFATTSAPGNDSVVGLFYGGGLSCLGIQCLGVIAIAAWTAVTISLFFLLLKKTIGLRVSPEDEITGLDISEHGLVSAYADFMPAMGAGVASIGTVTAEPAAPASASAPAAAAPAPVSVDDAVPVQVRSPKPVASDSDVKLTNVTILLHQEKFEDLKAAMMGIGITGMTVTNVMGCGVQKGKPEYYRGVAQDITLLPRMQVEIVVSKVPVQTVVDTAKQVLYTGHIGDGKIFIYNVENVIKVRTGEEGYAALQDVEQF